MWTIIFGKKCEGAEPEHVKVWEITGCKTVSFFLYINLNLKLTRQLHR